jgi:tubulin beta
MCDCDPHSGAYLTASALFRDQVSSQEVDQQILIIQTRNSSYFVQWISLNVQRSICDVPPRGLKTGATLITNTPSLYSLGFIKMCFTCE